MRHARYVRILALALFSACPVVAAPPSISAGGQHSLALGTDGVVRSWGNDRSGQLGVGRRLSALAPVVVPLSGVISILAGDGYSLVARQDGSAWAWGNNGAYAEPREAPWSVPAPISGLANVTAVAGRNYSAAALTSDGRVWTWGEDNDGSLGDGLLRNRGTPSPVPGLTNVIGISVATSHMAALRGDGIVFTWGSNDHGQLGDGTRASRSTPRAVAGLTDVKQVSAYGSFTFALKQDGSVWAWGDNQYGQMGDGTDVERLSPIRIDTLPPIAAISAQGTLALATDGTVWDWGYGPIGGKPGGLPGQVDGLADVKQVSGGGSHQLVLKRDGTVWGWGYNVVGQLADGTREYRATPARVGNLTDVEEISAGYGHNIARKRDNSIVTWGANENGELGDSSVLERTTPVAVPGLDQVTAIAAGDSHSVALRSDGSVWNWGENDQGRLGIGNDQNQSAPVRVFSGVKDIAAGGLHTLAVKTDGTVWGWGYTYQGQLGTGTTHDGTRLPVQSIGLSGMRQVSAGYLHSAAVKDDGSVWTWGDNSSGQMGDGTREVRPTPATVAGLPNITAVSAGAYHTVALGSDGSVWAWGNNEFGQLGNGTRERGLFPARVGGLPAISAISAGGGETLALATDGTVWVWGENGGGSGTDADPLRPARVAELTDVAAITAGRGVYYGHSIARRRDGTVFSWGNPYNGKLGDGTYAEREKAVVIVRENGAGSPQTNDWYLDLDPAAAKSIPPEKVPVFSVVLSGNDSSISAKLSFRPQDVGTTGAVFAFAYAPASLVKGAAEGKAGDYGLKAKRGGKETAVACVLAQLDASGQLVAVTAAQMQAFVSGVLGAQGASVTILNGVPSINIGGATFYVGYGTNGTTMITNGTNRSVVSAPGSTQCQPQAPKTGWWWNPAEDGRGFSIEMRGNHLFFASFLYDITGRSTWYVSSGPASLDGSLYAGDLLSARGGQTLAGPYPGFPTLKNEGPITLAFATGSTGLMSWPGGNVPIQRFNIVPGGAAAGPSATSPSSGWWWNEQESGRGFFMEWQGNTLDIAGYMYDDAGNPVWYLTVGEMSANGTVFSGNWWSYGNGQTLTGAWKPNARLSTNVAPLGITFSAPDTAFMTLPNGRVLSLKRQPF